MEIQYRNTREDYRATYEFNWKQTRERQLGEYYESLAWYLIVIGLAVYIAAKHEEGFACCVFAVVAFLYLRQNWSFAARWNAQLEGYADLMPETSARMILDEAGITEQCPSFELRVPWSEVSGFSLTEKRVLLHVNKNRTFVIPLRHVSDAQREELMRVLDHHGVPKKE